MRNVDEFFNVNIFLDSFEVATIGATVIDNFVEQDIVYDRPKLVVPFNKLFIGIDEGVFEVLAVGTLSSSFCFTVYV